MQIQAVSVSLEINGHCLVLQGRYILQYTPGVAVEVGNQDGLLLVLQ